MINLKQVSKSFGENVVLKDISLDIGNGEIFGLIGKNGVGKTTLLSIIAGLTDVTNGQCCINGKIISRKTPYEKVGYLPDVPNFFDFMTAGEFIDFLLQKVDGFKEKRDKLLQLAGIDKKTIIKTMSRGTRQRLGLAATLVNNPDVILLDEPSSALDPQGRYELSETLLKLKKQGKTIILSTHILTDLERICDKIGFLHNGFIVKTIYPYQTYNTTKIRIAFKNPINTSTFNIPSLSVFAENDRNIILSGDIQKLAVQNNILKELILTENPIVSINTLSVDLNDVFMEVCR